MSRFSAGLLVLLLALPQGQARAQQTGNPHGSIREACATCHQSESWKTVRISPAFVHAARTFPLSGAHARVACMTCHRSPEFQKTSATCASCHSDVHKGELGAECSRCHSTRSFVDRATMQQAHALTRFPLRGAHAAAACTDCHAPTPAGQAQFVNKSTQCFSCHAADFRRATSPNHEGAKFSTDCGSCHTISTWSGGRFDHSKTLFPLTGAHLAQLCGACHADRVFEGRSTTCVSCHQTDYDRSANPPHGGFPTTCASCHTTAAWKGAKFDHSTDTKYPLTGAHLAATCADCHSDGVYSGKPTTCVACHQADYNKTVNPQHATLGFPTACQSCHTTAQWRGATFDHGLTAFPLTGAHRAVTCNDCHSGGVYKGTPVACASCHKAVYDASTNPHHAPAGFSTLCQSCHVTNPGWKPATFDHSATRFALTGAHIAQICAACHADKVYAGKPTTCVSCHLVDYNNTTSPKHSSVGYPTDCQSCHTTSQWPGANFNHSATAFPLLGAHLAVACADCHVNNVYKGTSTACTSCHQTDFNNSTSPHHVQAGFSTQCLTCHTMNAGWKPATFDHSKTLFPLTGAHIAQICAACHADKVYAGKPTTCVSCHLVDYNNTTSPKHSAVGYPTDCQSCHTTTQWPGANFNHSATAFPLLGAHLAVACADCHVNNVYKGTPTTCASCHQTDFNNSTNPHHVQAGFSTVCLSCHTMTPGWKPATFDHSKTLFPLTGAHIAQICAACHADKVYAGKSVLCISCHQADWNATATPPHAASGFPTTCTSCHTTTQWLGAAFDHSTTAFPLTGSHLAASCKDCHGTGVYKGTPTTCVSCHLAVYNNSTNPHHIPAGFSTVCQSCHTTNPGWRPAPYDHSKTLFPLTGAHIAQICSACHADKVYAGKPTSCESCHLADYNATLNPNHKAAFFPTTCASCHTTTQWLGATFNHDGAWFPIYSGSHLGRWSTCADCHTNSSNYKVFECITCHAHDKTTTDSHHSSVPNYQYVSTACYACHPRGTH